LSPRIGVVINEGILQECYISLLLTHTTTQPLMIGLLLGQAATAGGGVCFRISGSIKRGGEEILTNKRVKNKNHTVESTRMGVGVARVFF
jgi:hypothetical protein